MLTGFQNIFHTKEEINAMECSTQHNGEIEEYFLKKARAILDEKLAQYDEEQIKLAMREILLSVFDGHWKDHLLNMDHLREGINLQAYAQKDPLNEYKHRAFSMFEQMRLEIKKTVVNNVFSVRLYSAEEIEEIKRQQQEMLEAQLEAHKRQEQAEAGKNQPIKRKSNKVGRNDPCPCGSGKKFKHCHGK